MTLEEELKQEETSRNSWTMESKSKCGNAFRFIKGDGEYAVISKRTLKNLQARKRIKISGDTLEWLEESYSF